ncbi:DUF1542 domain-containing protein [Streptococcus sp. 1032]|uniref:DUF1542 domain-containing protein n=1 Tax=Streptococcus sp. 1032 TaxID=2582657 RepID=UPI001564E329|nr:DUF1542 domain-containing protein [Streptococcus sp. 1032]
MFYKGNEDREKRLRFSIRKVSFGAASVAVAALFMFPGNGTVSATEQGVTPTNEGRQGSPLKDPDVQNGTYGATPVVSQLDGNSGSSETTVSKEKEETTTPTSTDASAPSVESPTVSKEKEGSSTTATPAPVVSSTASATEKAEEKATSDLDKKQLEDYVAEIDAKLASGSYATKTDESVATLKEHLELAKLALTTATSQDELTKAYRKLFMTASSGLRSKPKAQVESPKLDTTEGKATVGKKASNTEKATGTNSIANSGQHDPRNGQALDRNNPFRTDGTTTDTDPSANQTYTEPAENADLKTLADKLKTLPNVIENNKKVQNMDELGNAKNLVKGSVTEIKEFGGWKAVGENGKFAIARKTESGVFPAYTVNINRTNQVWVREQSFDRSSEYILLLSKLVTKQNRTEPVYDDKPYLENNEPGAKTARSAKWFDGIEKTFKAYASNEGTKVTVNFKTGYTGDNNGSKAKYKVEVFSIENGNEKSIYTAVVSPENNVNSTEMKVVAARDGNAKNQIFNANNLSKEQIEEKLALTENRPNATGGTFTSREINLPKGVTSYKVRISLENKHQAGMSYNSSYLQYSLPITGLDFNVNQDTSIVAKNLLQRIYDKLKATEEGDIKGKTEVTINAYREQLSNVKKLLNGELKTTQDYKNIVTAVLDGQRALRTDKSKLDTSNTKLLNLINENPDPRIGKTPNSITPYDSAKTEAINAQEEAETILNQENPDPDVVAAAVSKLNEKLAELKAAKAGLVVAATDAQKSKLATDVVKLVKADTKGKTQDSIDVYEIKYNALKAELDTAIEAAKAVANAQENASKVSALEAQEKVTEVKEKLAEAKELLKDKGDVTELKVAKNDLNNYINQQLNLNVTQGKTTSTKNAYDTANLAAQKSVNDAQLVIDSQNSTIEDVANALADVNAKKTALEAAKKALADKVTEEQKAALGNADEDLKLADKTGKTNDSIKAYNDEVGKLSADLEAAKQAAKDLLAKGDNAGELEAYRLQAKIDKLKSKLATAAKLLKDIDKSAVKKEVEEAAKNATDTIEANVDLPADKKAEAKAKIADEANKAIAAIDDATTEDDVTAAKNAGKLAIAKEAAKAELEAAQAIKEKVIAGNEKLSDDEKQAVKEQVQNVVDEAKKAIDAATEQVAVDNAKTTGKEAIDALNPVGKEKALDEIQKVTEAKLEAIDKNEKLSEKEKIKAKAEVAKAAIAVVEAIEAATTQAEVDAKVTEGSQAISSVAEVGKDKAKSAIDSALSAKETAIDANDKLSDAEKSEAKAAAKKAAEDVKKAIESATTQAEVDAKVTEGSQAISSVAEVGKDKAKAAVDSALSAKETAIDSNAKLSDAEKLAAKAVAKKAAEDAKKAIESATIQAEVDEAKTTGITAISAVNPVGKEKALAEIETALAEKSKAIDARTDLLTAEKTTAKKAAESEAETAKDAIRKAMSQDDVAKVTEVGKANIAKIDPVGAKAEFKKAVKEVLADKLKEIDARTDLTLEEKDKKKESVREEAEAANIAIDSSTTQAELDKVLRTFLYQVDQDALVADLPELKLEDALKALINGVVKVERGTALSQADVLAKLDLPEEISVIKMVLPDTNTIGTKIATVTLRLADGSVQKLEVPVEVISPNNQDMIPPYNGGNYGPSADNGMTNTQAKVNKSKLESAIHQLDELIIQESAKLDAETAKEANALSADAKKVFANADASQAEVDAMVKRIEDFMAKLAPVADHVTPAEDQASQTPAVAPATAQAANANQEASAQANAPKASKELPNTGTADSTVAMVAAAASALLGLGLAGRRRKEDEEA